MKKLKNLVKLESCKYFINYYCGYGMFYFYVFIVVFGRFEEEEDEFGW